MFRSIRPVQVSACALLCSVFSYAAACAAHTGDPHVTITSGHVAWPVGGEKGTHVSHPAAGSLTAPSLNRIRQQMSRIPGGVDVVPAETYREQYAMTVRETLRTVPGVFAAPRYGEEARLSIRGSGLSRGFHLRGIQLFQDGIPLNFADGSGDFLEVDPLISRAVQVYKGANGLHFGATALGGAINLITPTGITAPDRNVLRFEGGSDETLRAHGSMARTFENGDFYGAVTGISSSGPRAQSNQKTGRVSSTVGIKVHDTAETRFYLALQNSNQEVPGTLVLDDALTSPTSAPAINRRNNYTRDIRSVRVANKTSFRLDDRHLLETGVFMTARDLYHPIFQVLDQDWFQTGAFARMSGGATMGEMAHTYILGSTVRWGRIDAEQYINSLGSRGAKTGDSTQDALQYEFYGEHHLYVLPDLAIVAGAQVMQAERTLTNHLNSLADASSRYTTFSPRMGLVWDAVPGTQVFANLSRSVEPPTFSELVQTGVTGFVPLAPQRAWTMEIGTRGQSGRAAWDISVYRSIIRGEMLNFVTGPDIPAATFNADDTVHQGIELGLDLEIGTGWLSMDDGDHSLVFHQVYTLNDFFFDRDPQYGDGTLAGIPPHVWYGELSYRHHLGLRLAPNLIWVPDGGYVDYANTLQAPGYTLVGLRVGYDLAPGVDVFVDGRNLLDKRHVSNFSTITDARTAGQAVFYPGEGRNLFAGVIIRF